MLRLESAVFCSGFISCISCCLPIASGCFGQRAIYNSGDACVFRVFSVGGPRRCLAWGVRARGSSFDPAAGCFWLRLPPSSSSRPHAVTLRCVHVWQLLLAQRHLIFDVDCVCFFIEVRLLVVEYLLRLILYFVELGDVCNGLVPCIECLPIVKRRMFATCLVQFG